MDAFPDAEEDENSSLELLDSIGMSLPSWPLERTALLTKRIRGDNPAESDCPKKAKQMDAFLEEEEEVHLREFMKMTGFPTSLFNRLYDGGKRYNGGATGMLQMMEGFSDRPVEYKLKRLMELSKEGKLAAVRSLIETHGLLTDIEHRDEETGNTPLLAACSGGEAADETAVYLLSVGASHTAKNHAGEDAKELAVANDCFGACLALVARGVDLGDGLMEGYGVRVVVSDNDDDEEAFAASVAARKAALRSAYANGPHPSQRWERRKHYLRFLAENGFRPLAHRIESDAAAAATAVAGVRPAPMPAGPTETAAERVRLHILGQVFSNEGVSREIAAFVPAV